MNFTFLFELAILLLIPYPNVRIFIDIDYVDYDTQHTETVRQDLGDYLLALMFIRIYFIFKCMFNYSIYNDAFSKKLCKDYGFYPGFVFIMKTKFVKSPRLTLALLFTMTVFVLSYIVHIFEMYFSIWPRTVVSVAEQGIFYDVVYLVIMTITTVGFGDYTTKTYPGKFVIMFTALWGAVMISIFVLIVSNIFNLSQREEKALAQIDVSRKAANAIV